MLLAPGTWIRHAACGSGPFVCVTAQQEQEKIKDLSFGFPFHSASWFSPSLFTFSLAEEGLEFAQSTVLCRYPVVSMTCLSAWTLCPLQISLAYTGSTCMLPSPLAKVDEVKQCNTFWKPELWSEGKIINLKRWEHLQQGPIIMVINLKRWEHLQQGLIIMVARALYSSFHCLLYNF